MRASRLAVVFFTLALLAFALTFADAARQSGRFASMESSAQLVERLGLTDLCLFTEARYTRHPSQADLHSALQDHPIGLEHFPSGSLLSPPRNLTAAYENLDRKTERAD